MKLKFIDLFSGVGGFRYSLESTCKLKGIETECVGFSEIDKFATKTYKANFNPSANEIEFGDITKINVDKMPSFDILFAGFPCQPFSLMGKKRGFADTRGTMFFHIEKMIAKKKPKFFILENVRGILTHDDGKTYEAIIKILEDKLGYHTITWMLNSRDYGVPQTRRRTYILGFIKKSDKNKITPPIEKETNNKTTWHILEKNVDEKYYISEKTLKVILSNGSGNFRSKSEINQLIARPLTATMHKMHRACQDNYFSDSYILGKFDKLTNTVMESNEGRSRIRKLTPKEAFRLQGYPDSFVKNAMKEGVSDTQLYRQAGNSITVNTVIEILSEVLDRTSLVKK